MASSLAAAMIGAYGARGNGNRTEPDPGPRLVPEGLASGTVVASSGVASRKAGGANWPMSLAERLADNELARLMSFPRSENHRFWLTLRSTSPA